MQQLVILEGDLSVIMSGTGPTKAKINVSLRNTSHWPIADSKWLKKSFFPISCSSHGSYMRCIKPTMYIGMYVAYRTIDSCYPCAGVFYSCKFDVITDSTEDSGTNDLLYCFPREGRDTNKLVAVRGMFLTLSNVMSDIANYPAKM